MHKIGNVTLNINKVINKTTYSDGDVENELLDMFKQGLTEKKRNEILDNKPTWPIRYHLAHERGNLVNWYDFKPGSRVLEVGSGCGAITEELVKFDIEVVGVELSERRARINAHRNKNSKNLSIVVGNLQDYLPEEKFDYVVCVGVLEYAGTFIDSNDPYGEFMRLLASFLKEDGKILLAIENRLGFKYLAGAKEDHTGGYFDGINNYPQKKNIRTFGRKEIKQLFNRCGLKINEYYYPHPDYKLPKIVYSDSYKPGSETFIPKNFFPSPSFDQSRKELFSEQLFVDALEDNGVYKHFSNSFLIEASSSEIETIDERVIFGLTRLNRNKKYQIRTTAVKKDGVIVFKKTALNNESKLHILRMIETYGVLHKYSKNSKLINIAKPLDYHKEGDYINFEYISGKNLENELLKLVINDHLVQAAELLNKYISIVREFSINNKQSLDISTEEIFEKNIFKDFDKKNIIQNGILDFNLDNFIIDSKGRWWLIDYEWRLDVPVPTEFIEYRAVQAFFSRYKDIIQTRGHRKEMLSNGISVVPKELLKLLEYSTKKLNLAHKIENDYIQSWILEKKFISEKPLKYDFISPENYFIDIVDKQIIDMDGAIHSLRSEVDRLLKKNENLNKEIEKIKSSRTYKIANRAARAKGKLTPRIKR
jgi:SAM-dependent methyltransferase